MKLKLFHHPASPYVRKVMILALEADLGRHIQIVPADVWNPTPELLEDVPPGRIPAMLAPEGLLIGSTLCCEYLDCLHDGPRMIPPDGPSRWRVLALSSLADAAMEAATAFVIERRTRIAGHVSEAVLERQVGRIRRSLDRMEAGDEATFATMSIGPIATACLLGYLDFRLPELDWRAGRARLAAWYEIFVDRPSMQATEPSVSTPTAHADGGAVSGRMAELVMHGRL